MIKFYKKNRSLSSGLTSCIRKNGNTGWLFQHAPVVKAIYACSYLLTAFLSITLSHAAGNVDEGDTVNIRTEVSGEINCGTPAVNISVHVTAESLENDFTVAWSGPNGFSSNTLQNTVSVPGMYYVKVMTNADTLRDSVEVVRNIPPPPSVELSKSGDFCTTDEVLLTCKTDSAKSFLVWRAPGQLGYIDVKTIAAITPGVYTVTVTDLDTKCYTVDSITVYNNKPIQVALPEDTQLTCGKPCVSLLLPNTEDISYAVTGQTGFYSQNDTVKICESGHYTIMGVAKSSGCFISQSLELSDQIMSAKARKTKDLTCKTGTTIIYGNSNDTDATFQWSGPGGFTSSVDANLITTPGVYVLTVINKNNNACQATDTVVVLRDISQPALTVTKLNDLNCVTPSSVLTALSENASVTFNWSGPNGFLASNVDSVEISDAGNYVVKATKTSNGCSVIDTVSVTSTLVTLPSQMQYFLTCDHPCLKLNLPKVNGVEYQTTGISGFTSSENPVVICSPGFYKVTATAPLSGCVTSIWFEVIEDFGLKLSVHKFNDIDCLKPSSVLTVSSPISGVNYSWQGPDGFHAQGDSIRVTVAGIYIVSARDSVSNCYEEQSVEVINNIYYPEVKIIKTKDLYCENDEALLMSSSSSDEVDFAWSGPFSFHSTDVHVKVQHAGVYRLQVTHLPSGCTVNREIEVNFDSTVFTSTVLDPLPITCERLSTKLTAMSSIMVSYKWFGPEGFQSNEYYPSTSTPGVYSVILTESLSKICQVTDTVVVKAFNDPIQLSISTSGDIYCAPGTLLAIVDNDYEHMLGSDDYIWTAPDGATLHGSYVVSEIPGTYNLEIKSTFTGCTASATTELIKFDCPEARDSDTQSMSVLNAPAVTAYPNPSKGAVVLSFVAATEAHYKLEVYSFDGMAYSLLEEDVKDGEAREVVFNSESNLHGMFIYRLITNDKVVTGKFLIAE